MFKMYEILRSWITTSKRTEIEGVVVTYNGVSESAWDEWTEIFNEWLPRFDEAGWLDGLNAIHVDTERFMGDGSGEYQWLSSNVILHPKPRLSSRYSISSSREEVLIHEMAHHAHRLKSGIFVSHQSEVVFNRTKRSFEKYVSEYAGTDQYEAVAETATGYILGNEYPDEVMSAYWELDGPKGLRRLRSYE